MPSAIFAVRAIASNLVVSAPLGLGPFHATCNEGRALKEQLSNSQDAMDKVYLFKTESQMTEMRAFLGIIAGTLSLIIATQLTIAAFEQFSSFSTSNPTNTIELYTPPNLGAPERTLGSGTR